MEGRIFSETENNFVFLIEAINVVVSDCRKRYIMLKLRERNFNYSQYFLTDASRLYKDIPTEFSSLRFAAHRRRWTFSSTRSAR